MPTESNSLRLERCIRTLLLLQFTEKYNPTQLAEMFGVSRRTVFRDILLLRKSGIPVEFDEDVGTYYIRGDFEGIRKSGLDVSDMLAIATAIESSTASAIPGFKEKIGVAWTKVVATLPMHASRPQLLNPLERVNGRDHGLADTQQIEVWNALFSAVVSEQQVAIRLDSNSQNAPLVFLPASIGMGSSGWHVVGKVEDAQDETRIDLSTIHSVEII